MDWLQKHIDDAEVIRLALVGRMASASATGTPAQVLEARQVHIPGELRALGESHDMARQIAANSRRGSRSSGKLFNSVLDLAWFDQLSLSRFA